MFIINSFNIESNASAGTWLVCQVQMLRVAFCMLSVALLGLETPALPGRTALLALLHGRTALLASDSLLVVPCHPCLPHVVVVRHKANPVGNYIKT